VGESALLTLVELVPPELVVRRKVPELLATHDVLRSGRLRRPQELVGATRKHGQVIRSRSYPGQLSGTRRPIVLDMVLGQGLVLTQKLPYARLSHIILTALHLVD